MPSMGLGAFTEDAMNTNGTKKRTSTKKPAAKTAPKKPKKEPKPDLVVFAIRLLPEERDSIHKAAGPGKATKFIRSLAVAASNGDLAAVKTMVEAINR